MTIQCSDVRAIDDDRLCSLLIDVLVGTLEHAERTKYRRLGLFSTGDSVGFPSLEFAVISAG